MEREKEPGEVLCCHKSCATRAYYQQNFFCRVRRFFLLFSSKRKDNFSVLGRVFTFHGFKKNKRIILILKRENSINTISCIHKPEILEATQVTHSTEFIPRFIWQPRRIWVFQLQKKQTFNENPPGTLQYTKNDGGKVLGKEKQWRWINAKRQNIIF